jgi:transcriptional regulator with XRE-family HTH domain
MTLDIRSARFLALVRRVADVLGSHAAAASATGLSPSYVGKILRGEVGDVKVRRATADAVAKSLNISLSWLSDSPQDPDTWAALAFPDSHARRTVESPPKAVESGTTIEQDAIEAAYLLTSSGTTEEEELRVLKSLAMRVLTEDRKTRLALQTVTPRFHPEQALAAGRALAKLIADAAPDHVRDEWWESIVAAAAAASDEG